MEQSATSKEAISDNPIELLKSLRSQVYHDNTEELALGLGRPVEEVEAWMNGSESIDEDAAFKISRLADERLGGDTSGPEAAKDPNKSIEQRV